MISLNKKCPRTIGDNRKYGDFYNLLELLMIKIIDTFKRICYILHLPIKEGENIMNKSDTWVVETRREAAAAGRSKYWTGKRCNRNHESRRYTTTGTCCKCNSENAIAYKKQVTNELRGIVDLMSTITIKIHRNQKQALRDYADMLNKLEQPPTTIITRAPHLKGGIL